MDFDHEKLGVPQVHLAPGVARAIRVSLAGNGPARPIRIDLRSTGCCDASLCLRLDAICEDDLIEESDGLTFVMSPHMCRLTGAVTITCGRGEGEFILLPAKPLSEWDGFGVCRIVD